MEAPAPEGPVVRVETPAAEPASPLPPVLDRFLREIDRPSMLIRGSTGGGKTALALRVVARARGPTLWISTRTAGARNSPRLLSAPGTRGDLLRWVDLSVGGSDSEGLVSAAATARRALIERGHAPDREDAAYWLPPVLRNAWAALSDGPTLNVAIDSWEGFVDLYVDSEPDPSVDAATIERLLIGQLIRRGPRLLLVSERAGESPLDFEVDAILQVAHGELEERSVRVLTMPKLRGVTTDETIYPYTLEEGAFTYLPRTEHVAEYVRFRSEEDLQPGAPGLWPGSRDFASAFGRLPLGRFTLIEREDPVPPEVGRKIATTIALSVLRNGGRVLLVLTPGLSPEQVYDRFRTHFSAERLERSLRLIGVAAAAGDRPELRAVVIPGEGEVRSPEMSFLPVGDPGAPLAQAPLFPEATEFLLSSADDPYPAFALVDVEGLAFAAASLGRTPTSDLLLASLRRGSRGNPIHAIVTGVVGEPLLEPLRPLAHPLLRLVTRRGRIFALGYVPWTAAYAVLPPGGSETPAPYRLLRMS